MSLNDNLFTTRDALVDDSRLNDRKKADHLMLVFLLGHGNLLNSQLATLQLFPWTISWCIWSADKRYLFRPTTPAAGFTAELNFVFTL
jgi:hypothetical protein